MVLAPYVDVSAYPILDLSRVPGLDAVTLGFIISDSNKNPAWGGHYGIDSDHFSKNIEYCRKKNIDVICSFGGAYGTELAQAETDVEKLYQKYKLFAEKYKIKHLDFDIEGKALDDKAANARRAQCLTRLKKEGYHISLTVPVSPSGLFPKVLELVKQTPCDLVNIMAMCYGNVNDMGMAAVSAAVATRKQTGKNIGITVMIGKNDTGEVFTQRDAKMVADFKNRTPWIKLLSYWSLQRDRGIPGDLPQSSQIPQTPWEFIKLLK